MKPKKKKVFDIISYIVIGIVFVLSVAGLITKYNNGVIYLFGKRADVVLSDSMSEKNEKYKDFLEGHDNQIQKMDLVVSKKVTSDSELNVYDIVLFNNPLLGTTMHRIVDKQIKSCDSVVVNDSQIVDFKGQNAFVLTNLGSQFETSFIPYTGGKIVLYSTVEYDDNYLFVEGTNILEPTITTTKIDDYYINEFVFTRQSSSPTRFLITQSRDFDSSSFYFASVTLYLEGNEMVFTPNLFEKTDENNYEYKTNIVYQYEIRGDKAPNSDGIFLFKDIYSKVEYSIPKLGLFVRFITSIWGLVLMIGIGFILIGANVLLEYMDRKERKLNSVSTPDTSTIEKNEKEQEREKPERNEDENK